MLKKTIVIIKKNATQHDLDLANQQLNTLNGSYNALASDYGLLQSQLSQSQLSVATLQSSNNALVANSSLLSSQITSLNANVASLTTANNSLSSQVSSLSNQVTSLTNSNNSLSNANTSLSSQVSSLTTANNSLSNQVSSLNTTNTTLISQVSKLTYMCNGTTVTLTPNYVGTTVNVIVQTARPTTGFSIETWTRFLPCVIPVGYDCLKYVALGWKGGSTLPLYSDTGWNNAGTFGVRQFNGNSATTAIIDYAVASNGVSITFLNSRRPTDSANFMLITSLSVGVK